MGKLRGKWGDIYAAVKLNKKHMKLFNISLTHLQNVTYGFRLQTLQTTDYIQWSDYP